MKGTMLTITTDGDTRKRDYKGSRPTLEELQAEVGGFIEAPPFFDSMDLAGTRYHAVVYCNEEGKLRRLDPNAFATIAWLDAAMQHGQAVDDVLCGDVVILLGDKEFLHGAD